MMIKHYDLDFVTELNVYGHRLDAVLSKQCPDVSRSRVQNWIKDGQVTVDGEIVTKARFKLKGEESIVISAVIEEAGDWEAQDIPLDIVHEDPDFFIVNKPAGLVVHPAAGNHDGTLVNALLFRDEQLRCLPRAGIIHRLDKDTSGLLVVARSIEAHTSLVEQLQNRSFEREYQCIVHGQMVSGGTVDEPIGRHAVSRKQMAVVANGREAITHFRLIEKFEQFTHLQVNLETGRTHQIRVHMAHLRFPLVGDPLYGRKNYVPSGTSETFKQNVRRFKRQALHARKLGIVHPITQEAQSWEIPAPEDYQQLLEYIKCEYEK